MITTIVAISRSRRDGIYTAAAFTLLLAIMHLLFKLTKVLILICKHGTKSFISSQIINFDWIELPCYLFVIIFAMIFEYDCPCPPAWQWQIGIAGLFFVWIIFLKYVSTFPLFGKYVLMLERIVVTYSKVALSIGIPLILAFSWPFYMAVHDPNVSVS